MMKFGLLFRPQDPPNAENIGRRWQETLDAAQAAEEAGFDGVFVPEHHMMPDGYLPAPLVACGANSPCTASTTRPRSPGSRRPSAWSARPGPAGRSTIRASTSR
jgi:hypothetical protein